MTAVAATGMVAQLVKKMVTGGPKQQLTIPPIPPLDPMATLGPFEFSLNTAAFQPLSRNTEFRWQQLNRIGRDPAAQFMGIGLDEITLSGVVYPHYKGGLGQVETMRDMAFLGQPQLLIYTIRYKAELAGLYCIKSVSEERTVFFSSGAPRKIEFKLTLIAYGEDQAVKRAKQGDPSASNKSKNSGTSSKKTAARKPIKKAS